MISVKTVNDLANQIHHEVISWRQHLHAHPELSFEEFETSKYIQSILKTWQIPFEIKASTGIVALLSGNKASTTSKCIALRADIDALPIQEKSDKPYTSKKSGIMHACGHDVHTASLLGTIYILNALKSQWSGKVKFIFQPGEEKSPGGASILIKEGALLDPNPAAIIGQHVMPQLPVGKVGFRPGIYMASADEIYIKVIGKGGHAAMPENLIDPVLIASHIIVALQQIVSRNASPKTPSVLSFGKMEAKGATNIIPDVVTLEGTFRTMNETWRTKAKQQIVTLVTSLAESMGGKAEVSFNPGYPHLENNPELTIFAKQAAEEYLGKEHVVELDLWMASEDFAFYTHETAGCFYRLGVRNDAKNIISPVHTPTFDVDEDALRIGSGLMAWITLKNLTLEQNV